MRKEPLVTGEYYHVYNRGTDKRSIFKNKLDIERFFVSMTEFNTVESIGSLYENSFLKHQLGRPTSKLVEFVAYCLNSNHYHFLIKQKVDDGVSEYMKKLGGGYTKYFNQKYKRSGVLFQGRFKSKHIDTNEYLLHLSAYINLNNKEELSGHKQLSKSSFDEYLGKSNDLLCKTDIVLGQFKNQNDYNKFALSSLEDISERKRLIKELEMFET